MGGCRRKSDCVDSADSDKATEAQQAATETGTTCYGKFLRGSRTSALELACSVVWF
jgi:hypothetical protein